MDRVLSLKNRKSLYALAAPIITLLASFGLIDNTQAAMWVALVGAALGLGIAALNTQDGLRKWVYGLAAPVQAVLIGYGAVSDEQAASIVGLAVFIGAIMLAGVNVEIGEDGQVELPGFQLPGEGHPSDDQ